MVGLWLLSLFLRDSSIVDIFWGIGFVLITWIFCYLTPEGYLPRKLLVSLMVSIWGLRLAIHIFKRNYQRGEDFRYAKWREEYGGRWWWQSLYKVFLLQGLVLWIISAPLLAAQWSPRPSTLTWLDYSGLAVWMVGFIFEAVGDFQLARFRSDPDNRGQRARKRSLALYPPPELLWRRSAVVGKLLNRSCSWRCLDNLQPNFDDCAAGPRFWRCAD